MAVGQYGGTNCIGGIHRAFVYDRGGARRMFPLLDLSQVVWGRERDAVSEGVVRLEGPSCTAQAKNLARMEPKRHELVIFRGRDRVWEGPINRITWAANYVEVNAHDIFEYFLGTPLTKAYSNASPNVATVTQRVSDILEFELPVWESLSPPARILAHYVAHAFPNEARTTAVTTPYEMTVGEHIQNLARSSGIDYTVVGRAFHVWDVSRNLGQTRTLTEADFLAPPVVTAYGSDFAARAYVGGNNGTYGSAGAPDPYYGPWTKIFTNYNEEGTQDPTESELNSQAARNLVGRNPVPVEVRIPDNTGIRLDRTLKITDLVPGVHMPLRAVLNARKLVQMQKLDSVKVTETSQGETVQVALMPASKPDLDDEEGN